MLSLFSSAKRVRAQTESRLETYNQPSVSFFLLISLSSALATLGLIIDNTAIVIGAMVVAPLITPIFGFSLRLIVMRLLHMFKSLGMLLAGTATAIAVAALLAWLITLLEGQAIFLTDEIISRTHPDLLFFLTALFSGMAGAYAYAKPDLKESLAGIAISVAVIPPLAVCGIGFVSLNWRLVESSLLLYGLNLAGICFGSIIMFLALGFGKDSSVANVTK